MSEELPYYVLKFRPDPDMPPPVPTLRSLAELERIMEETFERLFWQRIEEEIFWRKTDAVSE